MVRTSCCAGDGTDPHPISSCPITELLDVVRELLDVSHCVSCQRIDVIVAGGELLVL